MDTGSDAGTAGDAPEANDGDTTEPDDGDRWDEEAARRKWAKANNEARGLRQKLKELQPLADKAKELEEAGKTEADKLREALEAERTGRTAAESQLLRFEVATAKEVPAGLVRFLQGATREEIEASADELLTQVRPKKTGGKPGERAAMGAASSTEDDDLDPMEALRKVRAARGA